MSRLCVFFLFVLPIKLPYGLWDLTLEKKLHLNRDVKQQRRRRLRKRHLKSEFALQLQTLSRLFQLVQFVKCWPVFSELNSKRLYQSSGKKRSRCLVFTSSTKCEIWHFHVVVVQRRKRNVEKSVTQVQSCCFANLTLLLFCRSRCHRRRRC